MIKLLLKLK